MPGAAPNVRQRRSFPPHRKGRSAGRRNIMAPREDAFGVQASLGGSPQRFLGRTFLKGAPSEANNFSYASRRCLVPGSYYPDEGMLRAQTALPPVRTSVRKLQFAVAEGSSVPEDDAIQHGGKK